jgi:hypothetical protein
MTESLPATTTAEQDRAAADKRLTTAVLEPLTTAEEDRMTAGQRRVNILWEMTQAVIAVLVTAGTLFISGILVLRDNNQAATAFLLLSNAFFMIVTSYFQRTNHTRVGGLPPSPKEYR